MKKITFKSVSMKNFMSYGNVPTTVILDRPGTTLILGENLDNTTSGLGSNGVGKTTIINAISYALFDKPISKISKDKLINNINNKSMEVVVVFDIDSVEYRIARCRKDGANGNHTKLSINGVDQTVAGSRDINKDIEQIIGIPFDLFVRIATFTADLDAFFDLPARHVSQTNQTDLIEELFNLKTLSEKAEVLKLQIGDTEQSMETNLAKIEALKKEHERHNAQLASAQTRIDMWEEQRQRDIRAINSNLDRIKGIDVEQQHAFSLEAAAIKSEMEASQKKVSAFANEVLALYDDKSKNQREREKIEASLKKIEGVDVELQSSLNLELTELNTKLREAQSKQQVIEKEIGRTVTDENKIKHELSHLESATCPYCEQKYESSVQKLDELKEKQTKLVATLEAKTLELDSIDGIVETLTARQKVVKGQITISNFNELLDIKSKLDVYQAKLTELQAIDFETPIKAKNVLQLEAKATTDALKLKYNEVYDQITVSDFKELLDIKSKSEMYQQKLVELAEATNPHIGALTELQGYTIEPVDMAIVNELQTTLDHQKFLLKLLTKKDSFVRKALLDKSIPYLNQRLAHYLTELGLPHTVEFTHEMAAEISQFGKPLDFGNLSKGQRARVNVALSFAFRDVFQSMSNHINICMLDEVLDQGLDGVGVQAAARMLKRKARDEGLAMFIISHRDEIDSAFDRKMIVQMSNGFSYLRYEEG